VKPPDRGGVNSPFNPEIWLFLIGVTALFLFLEAATASRFLDKVRLALGAFHLLPSVVGVILVTGCLAGIGSAFFSLFPPTGEKSSWMFFVHLGLGIGIVQIVLTVTGYAGFLYVWPIRILFLVLLGMGIRHVLDSFRTLRQMVLDGFTLLKNSDKIEWFFFGVLVLQILFWLVASLSPPTGASALGYHLAQPKTFLESHHIYSRPDYYESAYPFGFEIWILFHFLFTDEIGARFSLFLIGIGALTLAAVLARVYRFSRSTFLVPALLANLTAMNETVSRMENDVFGLFFLFLGLIAIQRGLESGVGKWWIPATAALGTAISVKYLYLFPVFFCLVLAGYGLLRSEYQKIPSGIVATAIGLFLGLGGFWYLKNWYLWGNPLHPFQLSGWVR
jgi:hypothetical protein